MSHANYLVKFLAYASVFCRMNLTSSCKFMAYSHHHMTNYYQFQPHFSMSTQLMAEWLDTRTNSTLGAVHSIPSDLADFMQISDGHLTPNFVQASCPAYYNSFTCIPFTLHKI